MKMQKNQYNNGLSLWEKTGYSHSRIILPKHMG